MEIFYCGLLYYLRVATARKLSLESYGSQNWLTDIYATGRTLVHGRLPTLRTRRRFHESGQVPALFNLI
jgi:hypothetical protein